jgi:hypothetical protein
MTRFVAAVPLIALALTLACSDYTAPADVGHVPSLSTGRAGFGFNGSVRGFPTGAVRLTGGGSYDPGTASNTVPTPTTVKSAGGFDCLESVGQGPLLNCEARQGVRWDTEQLLASTTFKCTGADAAKLATTGPDVAVLQADFYRAGDGNDESFHAQMIVAGHDLADDIPGVQNLWVQGVGCGTAIVHFN